MRRFVIIMLFASLLTGGVVSYYASKAPDGLERVAELMGFAHTSKEPAVNVLPDYTVPGLTGFLSNGIAGVVGVAAVFGFVWLIGRAITRKNR